MYPILGRYGSFFLYSYSVVLGLGILAGVGLAVWLDRRQQDTSWHDALLASLVTGVVGGRIGFVISHWIYFQEQPSEAWQLWRGGLSYHGALLGGLIGAWVWCRWRGLAFSTLVNRLAPAFALATIFGWLACWLEGCAYGRVTPQGLMVADLPDSFGVYDLRFQTQLLAAGLSALCFLGLMRLRRHRRLDNLFWPALFGLSIIRVIVSLLRGDEAIMIYQLRIGTLFDGALALLSLILLQLTSKSVVQVNDDGAGNAEVAPIRHTD